MKKFRVIDTETTGFPPNAGVVEVGYTDVSWEGSQMTIGPTLTQLCNPGMPSEPGALATHRIRDIELEGQPHPSEVLATLEDDPDVCWFVAHNAKFDRAFIEVSKPWICTLRCAKMLIPEQKSYSNQQLFFNLGLHNHPELVWDRTDPPHRAGPDTYVTAFLLRHLLQLTAQQYSGQFIDKMIEWSNEAQILDVVAFGKHKGKKWSQVPLDYMRWMLANQNPDEDVRRTMEHYLKGGR
jgi:exodeoxyribonuclease X